MRQVKFVNVFKIKLGERTLQVLENIDDYKFLVFKTTTPNDVDLDFVISKDRWRLFAMAAIIAIGAILGWRDEVSEALKALFT